jgi:hypothetical protein
MRLLACLSWWVSSLGLVATGAAIAALTQCAWNRGLQGVIKCINNQMSLIITNLAE